MNDIPNKDAGNSEHEGRIKVRVGDLLLGKGIITQEQLDIALAAQRDPHGKRRKIGEILIEQKSITEVALAENLARQMQIPLYLLDRLHPSPAATKLVDKDLAMRMQAVPISLTQNILKIAMVTPQNVMARDELSMIVDKRFGGHIKIEVGVTTPTDIRNNLDRFYDIQSNLSGAIAEMARFTQEFRQDDDTDTMAPIVQLVWNFLSQAVRERASDIHVECGDRTGRIRYRVDGQLYVAQEYPTNLHPMLTSRLKIMSGMDIAERRKPQDGRLFYTFDGQRIDFRVSCLPIQVPGDKDNAQEKVVLRILYQDTDTVGLSHIGLDDEGIEKMRSFSSLPNGILLITGPTGSGKSKTLYSMLTEINDPRINITTVEDPVEFSIRGANQVHVNERAGMTFSAALRSILRQDPDKIMIGEIRDLETAEIAIRAALTGHLVFSTLHTNDAPSAATRLIDMGIPPFLVSASLVGVVAQRLVRKLCPHCREQYEIDPFTCERLGIPAGSTAYRPVGCSECREGYKGRRGIFEILTMTKKIRELILHGASDDEVKSQARTDGMKTLRDAGVACALAGVTSLEEVMTVTIGE